MLADIKLGQHLHRIVVEELVDRRELLRDRLDALLSSEATHEGTQWVEDSLALEGKQEKQSHHFGVLLQVLVTDLALFGERLGHFDKGLGVHQIPGPRHSLVLSSELLEGQEAQVRSLRILHFLEVGDCQVGIQRHAVGRAHDRVFEALERELDLALELLGNTVPPILFELSRVSNLEAVRGQHSHLVDRVIDAV